MSPTSGRSSRSSPSSVTSWSGFTARSSEPVPGFDSARPNVLWERTDHIFRYRVPHAGPPETVSFFLNVYFVGDRLSGWDLHEEYSDGRAFRYELGGSLVTTLLKFVAVFGLLFLFLFLFLKKYHAGEVGVGTGAWLFGGQLLLLLLVDLALHRAQGYGVGFGGTDAFQTAAAQVAFRFLFFDVPLATLVFLSWSVGESYARERWGDRLASFDALLRRDPFNATVGGSLLTGLLVSAAVGSVLLALLPLLRSFERPALHGTAVALLVPFLVLLALALAGLATRRCVEYRYEDLAPHVKRIAERERVKAEIDAANRIQAALLPPSDPKLPGVVVASHYRAATEIGGDYFDFLPLAEGKLGLAFGDVAGHGLTSGIVMAMAKSALLVQTGHDPSPVRVMEVLNETVRKMAPKRMLMTFFFGVLDPATGHLRYCSAGHLDPYVVRAGGGSVEPLSAWGFPLGVKRRPEGLARPAPAAVPAFRLRAEPPSPPRAPRASAASRP